MREMIINPEADLNYIAGDLEKEIDIQMWQQAVINYNIHLRTSVFTKHHNPKYEHELVRTLDIGGISQLLSEGLVVEIDYLDGDLTKNPKSRGCPDLVHMCYIGKGIVKDERRQGYSDSKIYYDFNGGGIEMKATGGTIKNQETLKIEPRLPNLSSSISFHAHHTNTKVLMGIFWDFSLYGIPQIKIMFFGNKIDKSCWLPLSVKNESSSTNSTSLNVKGTTMMKSNIILITHEQEYIDWMNEMTKKYSYLPVGAKIRASIFPKNLIHEQYEISL